MKEFSKKSLAMLFAMFMLGACSTDPVGGSKADTEVEAGLSDALEQLGDVDVSGMTKWVYSESGSYSDAGYSQSSKSTTDLYLGDDGKYVMVFAVYIEYSLNGESDVQTQKSAYEGTFEAVTPTKVVVLKPSEEQQPTEEDVTSTYAGYSAYVFTVTTEKIDEGDGWEDVNYGMSPYLAKIDGNSMKAVQGDYDVSSKTFNFDVYGDESVDVMEFKKQ